MNPKVDVFKFDSKGMSALNWSDLDKSAQRWIIGVAAYEVLEKLVVWHFIYHTPKEQTRGPKWMWYALSLINFAGPMSYALFGRKRG